MFTENLKETLNEDFNESLTANGAVGYRTSGRELLDMNFSVTSMRDMEEKQIIDKFVKAFYENKLLAVKWLFFARDIRGGIGERRLFRICLKYLAENHADIAEAVISLVPEYGRWDDLLCLLDTTLADAVASVIKKQLNEDNRRMQSGESISLCAKWMPSPSAHSEEKKKYARILIKKLNMTERNYRKLLSIMRSYLKLVEVLIARNEWKAIDYAAVPSRANLKYNSAFLRHDEERRREYLNSLQRGETKIHAGVLFPHDIVYEYYRKRYEIDVTLEELWKALPDYVEGAGNTICVADGSGSMNRTIGDTSITALSVANALAIYFAERSSGQFKDNYITFSERPQLVDLSNANSLKEKLEIARHYNEVANTNIEAVFDLILQTAVNKHMKQADLPENILILSDMEFDACATCGVRQRWGINKPGVKLFDTFKEKYTEYGYKLPRLVFWNICSRSGTIPVKENDLGVALVSGFSPAVVKMVLSNSTDPYVCLLEQLNSERYYNVECAYNDALFSKEHHEAYISAGARERYALRYGDESIVYINGNKCLKYSYSESERYQDANGVIYDTVRKAWID